MSQNVVTVTPDQTIDDCMVLMTRERVRHLPVIAAGNIVGIISIGDVVKAMLQERETKIQDLQHYIMGEGYGQ